MENTEQRVNGPKWSNRTAHFVWTGPTKKRGPARDPWERGCSKLFRFDRTDPFSFKPKFQGTQFLFSKQQNLFPRRTMLPALLNLETFAPVTMLPSLARSLEWQRKDLQV